MTADIILNLSKVKHACFIHALNEFLIELPLCPLLFWPSRQYVQITDYRAAVLFRFDKSPVCA